MDIFKECYRKKFEMIKNQVRPNELPELLIVRAKTNSQESDSYVKSKMKIASELGILVKQIFVESLYEALLPMKDSKAFIVQMPFYDETAKSIGEFIDDYCLYHRDVDGFSPYQKNLLLNESYEALKPATAQGVMWYLKDIYDGQLAGKTITIVNRSELIGRPLIEMCLQEDMGVNIRHSKCKAEIFDTNIVVTGVGIRYEYDACNIGTEACGDSLVETVIDCGMDRVVGIPGVGDWYKEEIIEDFPEINIASGYGYTGPMTCLALMYNVLKANYLL